MRIYNSKSNSMRKLLFTHSRTHTHSSQNTKINKIEKSVNTKISTELSILVIISLKWKNKYGNYFSWANKNQKKQQKKKKISFPSLGLNSGM